VRVPLIWSWPGHIEQGLVGDGLVELTDKAPTILDFLGIEPPQPMQGRSLRPILEGRADPVLHRDFVRCEYYDALDLPEGSLATMYRDRRHKLVSYHQHEFGELYDLVADPWEFDNLWDLPERQGLKLRLMKASFDATMRSIDLGSPRIGPM
jgi:arylsulfatase A-like enzyme